MKEMFFETKILQKNTVLVIYFIFFIFGQQRAEEKLNSYKR
jgi:hypothetical protein